MGLPGLIRHRRKLPHALPGSGKKRRHPEGAAKFREETSKKADSAVSDRIAAMHNVARP
jgi:hypothetical protein